MFILHIALQGCLRARNVPYGITPDTGGHIKYLLELAAAADRSKAVHRQQIVVRRFVDVALGADYATACDTISPKSEIVRLDGADLAYRSKEEMAGQIDALDRSLTRHLRSLDRLPDIIHAHYADAGALALRMKRRFGIPYVFTAHSLGRVKREVTRELRNDAGLAARIRTEDAVIAAADRIIASSSNEKQLQYGLYPNAPRARIRVNPPGCDLTQFRSSLNGCEAAVAELTAPFLRRPDLPPVLALARPVRKKNLAALVRVFGTTPGLRHRANLVLFTGCRTGIDDLDPEGRAVLTELLTLIDRYDLWGSVALPKTHTAADLPAIYRYAANRGGVFVNPAFNEPFGLTLLEAAASGLPVIATNSGGPVDIVGRCENGRIVDVRDAAALGAEIAALLADPIEWATAARNGIENVQFYNWDRHVRDYLEDLLPLAAGIDGSGAKSRPGSRPMVRNGPMEPAERPTLDPNRTQAG